MKNLSKLIMLSSFLLVGACNSPERTIGFVTGDNAEMQWHLGTQAAIDIVSTVDGLWAAQDYEGMRPYFADSLVFTSYDGSTTNTFDDFVEAMTSQPTVSWTYDYAFSVDLDPAVGGEHVQAGFSVNYSATENSEEYTDLHHESYYVVEGKIITLNQFAIRGDSDE